MENQGSLNEDFHSNRADKNLSGGENKAQPGGAKAYTKSGDYRLPGSLECALGTFMLKCTALLPCSVRDVILRRHSFYQVFDETVEKDQQGVSSRKWEVISQACSFKGKRVLDIGCAEGFFAMQAALNGATAVTGVDSSMGTLLSARCIALKKGLPIRYRRGVFPNLGLHSKFDVVLCLSVLHHTTSTKDIWKVLSRPAFAADLKALRANLKRLSDFLSPGGYCIIEMPYEWDDPAEREEADFERFCVELRQNGFASAKSLGAWDFKEEHLGKKDRIIYVAEKAK